MGANAVWQLHLDWLLKQNSRFSFNYLIDELTLDPKIQKGKKNSSAFSIKFSHSLFSSKERFLNFYILYTSAGSQTFRHGLGSNNFVQSYKPLGWENGSDGEEVIIGLSYLLNQKLLLDIKGSSLQTKEQSLLNNPYQSYEYVEGFHLSNREYFIDYKSLQTSVIYSMLENMDIFFDGKIVKTNNLHLEFKLGLTYYKL